MDIVKAFNSICLKAVIETLISQGIDIIYIEILGNINKDAMVRIKIIEDSSKFHIGRGVHQNY